MQEADWFRETKFGMIIHWGLYVPPARGWCVKRKTTHGDMSYSTVIGNLKSAVRVTELLYHLND